LPMPTLPKTLDARGIVELIRLLTLNLNELARAFVYQTRQSRLLPPATLLKPV
jgi:hypothetical protein